MSWVGLDQRIIANRYQQMFVNGYLDVNGRTIVQGDLSLNNRLFVAGDASLNSKLFVAGDVSLNTKVTVAGDASLNAKLTVAGDVSFNGFVQMAKDVSLNANLYVKSDTSLNGNVQIQGNLVVNGNLTAVKIANKYIINTTTNNYQLIVSEDISLNGRLFVGGNVGIGTGNPSCALDVSGVTRTQGLLTKTIFVNAYVQGDASWYGSFVEITGSNNHSLKLPTAVGFSATITIWNNSTIVQTINTFAAGQKIYGLNGDTVAYSLGLGAMITIQSDTYNWIIISNTNQYSRLYELNNGNVGIGTTNPGAALDVVGGTQNNAATGANTTPMTTAAALRIHTNTVALGSAAGNLLPLLYLRSNSGGSANSLSIYNYRNSAGSDWTTSSMRMQHTVDNTNQGYLEFNPPGITGGIGLYTTGNSGSGSTNLNPSTQGITIMQDGKVGIGSTTPTVALDVVGNVRCTAGIDLNYSSLPTFASNQIGCVYNGTSLNVVTYNSTLQTVFYLRLQQKGIYIITGAACINTVNTNTNCTINIGYTTSTGSVPTTSSPVIATYISLVQFPAFTTLYGCGNFARIFENTNSDIYILLAVATSGGSGSAIGGDNQHLKAVRIA
jgi:cytoskeletal protein CcmA (bactofilin family)